MENDGITNKKNKDTASVSFTEIHSDEMHENKTPQSAPINFSSKENTHNKTKTTFNVGDALAGDRSEEGIIVRDKKRDRLSFFQSLRRAFDEWLVDARSHLHTTQKKVSNMKQKKDMHIAPAETRKEIIMQASTYANLPPRDDSKIVIEKIKTFKKDVAHINHTPNIKALTQSEELKNESWRTSGQSSKNNEDITGKKPEDKKDEHSWKKFNIPDLRESTIAPVVSPVVTKLTSSEFFVSNKVSQKPQAHIHTSSTQIDARKNPIHVAPIVPIIPEKNTIQVHETHSENLHQKPKENVTMPFPQKYSIASNEDTSLHWETNNDTYHNIDGKKIDESNFLSSMLTDQNVPKIHVPSQENINAFSKHEIAPNIPISAKNQKSSNDTASEHGGLNVITSRDIEDGNTDMSINPTSASQNILTSQISPTPIGVSDVISSSKKILPSKQTSVPILDNIPVPQPLSFVGQYGNRIAIIIFVVLSGSMLAFFIKLYIVPSFKNQFTVNTPARKDIATSTIIGFNAVRTVNVLDTTKTFRETLTEVVHTSDSGITYIKCTADNEEISSKDFLGYLGVGLSQSAQHTLDTQFMIGTITTNTSAPFLILRTHNFDTLFAGMLAWEDQIMDDLSPVFGERSSSQNFSDTIVDNVPTRVLRDEKGNTLLVYAIVKKQTLIITTDTTTLMTLIEKL